MASPFLTVGPFVSDTEIILRRVRKIVGERSGTLLRLRSRFNGLSQDESGRGEGSVSIGRRRWLFYALVCVVFLECVGLPTERFVRFRGWKPQRRRYWAWHGWATAQVRLPAGSTARSRKMSIKSAFPAGGPPGSIRWLWMNSDPRAGAVRSPRSDICRSAPTRRGASGAERQGGCTASVPAHCPRRRSVVHVRAKASSAEPAIDRARSEFGIGSRTRRNG